MLPWAVQDQAGIKYAWGIFSETEPTQLKKYFSFEKFNYESFTKSVILFLWYKICDEKKNLWWSLYRMKSEPALAWNPRLWTVGLTSYLIQSNLLLLLSGYPKYRPRLSPTGLFLATSPFDPHMLVDATLCSEPFRKLFQTPAVWKIAFPLCIPQSTYSFLFFRTITCCMFWSSLLGHELLENRDLLCFTFVLVKGSPTLGIKKW